MVIAIVAAGAGAVTGVAAAAPTPPRPADGPSRLVAAAARDLGLTPEQVRTRFARDAAAARTLAALRERLADAYAGGWVTGDAGALVVAVTDTRSAAAVRAAGAEPRLVARSGSRLEADRARLDAAAKSAPEGVHGWYVDVATNRVVVAADTTTLAAAFAAAAGVDARAEVSPDAPRLRFDVRGGDPYYPNGAPGHCSIGFSVQGGYVTAGHCGETGDSALGFNRVAQGTFAGSSFPENDYAWVQTNADWTPLGVVYDYAGGTVPVAGATVAPVGAAVCRSGFTTGWRCGVIEAHDQTVNYIEGTVRGLTRTTACSQSGDSGGSYIAGDQAQGVLSGGSGTCSTSGGRTFYQPVAEILNRYGLTLITSGGGPGPGPGSCEGFPTAPSTGTLSRTAAVQYRPSSSGFAAAAGFAHRACLTGPAAANFDLQLQRRTGAFSWTTVARSEGPTSAETIQFTGAAGTYRYRLVSASGSGQYSLSFTR
jgi:streptogrisin C